MHRAGEVCHALGMPGLGQTTGAGRVADGENPHGWFIACLVMVSVAGPILLRFQGPDGGWRPEGEAGKSPSHTQILGVMLRCTIALCGFQPCKPRAATRPRRLPTQLF